MSDIDYLRHTLSGRNMVTRNPDLCVCAFACACVYRDGSRFRCRIIDEVNKEIQSRIDDYNQAVERCRREKQITGKEWGA